VWCVLSNQSDSPSSKPNNRVVAMITEGDRNTLAMKSCNRKPIKAHGTVASTIPLASKLWSLVLKKPIKRGSKY